MKIVVTDLEYQMPEDVDDGSIKSIKDRWGWWDIDKETGELFIYVYKPVHKGIQIFGCAFHEIMEYFLIKKLGMNENSVWPHRFCCIVEMIITFGRAWKVLCWR